VEEALTDEETAKLRSVVTFQKVVLVIILRWWLLVAFVFFVLFAMFSGFLVMRASKSVKRYEAKTRLLFNPKKILRVDAPSDRQLMSILDRRSLKRRVAERVKMDSSEQTCLSVDMKLSQEKRPTNLFTINAASRTMKGAVEKANAFAEILIDEYVAFRTKDLDDWRIALEARRKDLADKIAELDAKESEIKTKSGVLTPKEALVALNTLISDQRRNAAALGVDLSNEQLKKSKFEALVGGNGAAVMANAQAIRRRADALSALDAELSKLRERYTDINPRVAGKVRERDERVAELKEFLKAKGAEGLDIDKIDQAEKAAGELADCATRIEAILQRKNALELEIKENEKKVSSLAGMVQDFDKFESRRTDLVASLRDVDDQLGGISYAESSLRNDLRQIERAGGAGDSGPFGARQAILAFIGASGLTGGLLLIIVVLEFVFGKVRGGREISLYDGIDFLGSLPKPGSMPETEVLEVMGVVAQKALLAAKDSKAILVCRLPGAEVDKRFVDKMDYTASMAGTSSLLLDVVSQNGFEPPEGVEQMLGVVRMGTRGWFPVANRFALAPTELELLKVDLKTLGETFDNVFIRMEGGIRIGGSFFDQLLGICGGVLLLAGAGRTPRTLFAYARRHLKASEKPVLAIATGADAKTVRREMEELT
jgi:hypothetical protein